MYVSVKGGEQAIANAHRWLAERRRGSLDTPELSLEQILQQQSLAVSRVMAEGSLYAPELAALAIKQSQGDLVEAVFLLRAYRTTLPRLAGSIPIDTGKRVCERRISATFKDVPGGQLLGPTYDYTHRLLDFALAAEGLEPPPAALERPLSQASSQPKVSAVLGKEGLLQAEVPTEDNPSDLTREPLTLPASRSTRLQALARADEGFLLGLAYSTQRGYASTHAFVGDLRVGYVAVSVFIPDLGLEVEIGEIRVTECESVNQFTGSAEQGPQFTRGYGLVFGHGERKALSMALVDRALRWQELGEACKGVPAQDEEFVLAHGDNIQATGFLEHLKLPHYVDFQSELQMLREMRAQRAAAERASAVGDETI